MQTGHAPLTQTLAAYVSAFKPTDLPEQVRSRTLDMVLDGSGALLAAANPQFSTGRLIAGLVAELGGRAIASVVGHGFRTSPVDAALANGTMGYACDVEPHHPGGVLHPIAVMVPTALAAAELVGATGTQFVAAVALGCEVEYRLSMALGPVEQYNLGFHPSAVCGCFGATAAASFLLGLDRDQAVNAFGLAGCQASGLMAWESDPTENARPFQMGMAARNGITAALLASRGFGGPTAIFDEGHTIFRAFSRNPQPERLTRDLGQRFDGIMELAIKPYSSVSFLHPALDALLGLMRAHRLRIEDVAALTIRFPKSGAHCIDGNPLKSHCAQYILPVAITERGLSVADLFVDRRDNDAEVARLSRKVAVVRDETLDREFPRRYATIIELETRAGQRYAERNDTARGYPEAPLSAEEITDKFRRMAGTVAKPARVAALENALRGLWQAPRVTAFAELMSAKPDTVAP
jgi:2-methylcitrate dehydratase PrpD